MAATSMMKEYLKKQLKYWVDNFKDDQLPRDFNSKNFSRAQITLHKITLKPDKLAALLKIPAPLIVTRATCTELTIKVPSWSVAEKFVQEPLSLRIGDLFIDVKHLHECDEHVRRDSIARAKAAIMEPDPLGSIASMYQFATIIHERLEITVENVTVKLYEAQALRLRVEMAHFHARTTNAMWQDMRDLTECVDRSPDGLLKTRFKFVSTQCSVFLHETTPGSGGAAAGSADQAGPPPIKLLRDHAIAMRMTLFGHRKTKHDAWEVLSSVVDLNLETLPFDLDAKQLRQVYAMYMTVVKWMDDANAVAKEGDKSGLLPHQLMRGPLTPTKKPTVENGEKEVSDNAESTDSDSSSFALQVTVRFTAHALLRVHSTRRGDLQLALIAQHAAVNWIQHHDASHEVHVTVHDLSVRHKDKVLFHIKPARDVLQFKRLASDQSMFLKWHLQKLECHLENEIAMVANELYHSFNEMEQAATITCGTCHHKIRLDAIEHHVCSASAPATPSVSPRSTAPTTASVVNDSRRNSLEPSSVEATSGETSSVSWLDSTRIPKLRVVFALDELEIVTDSYLFSTVQELMRSGDTKVPSLPPPARRFTLKMKDWSVSTESKEFVGDAIFVPVLPLAFQMLECTIRGCGCVQKLQQRQKRRNGKATPEPEDDTIAMCGASHQLPRWPDRIFAELGHASMKTIDVATTVETFMVADNASLRLSFSDGVKICPQSTPQMSSYFHVERIRCQLEHHAFQQVRSFLSKLQDPLEGHVITALTLFFAVMEIRNVELTLLHENPQKSEAPARMKAQFRHVGGVADNHHGHLSLQTNFDFRALLQSDAVQFAFQRSGNKDEDDEEKTVVETKRERRRKRVEALREASAARIQRVFRRFAAARRLLIDQQLRQLTHEDDDQPTGDDLKSQRDADEARRVDSLPDSDTATQRRKSSSKTALFGSAEDLAAINPMKMVAAATVLKDGVMGFVKAKQHQIETDLTGLATQSKESAARFMPSMPKYNAVRNMLSPRMSVTHGDGGVMAEPVVEKPQKQEEVRTVDPHPVEAPVEGDAETEDTRSEDEDGEQSTDRTRSKDRQESHAGSEEATSEQDEEDAEEASTRDDGDGRDEEEEREEIYERNDEEVAPETVALSPTEAMLASLPPVVRVMVQVQEHRLCVPINPRESVGVLCKDIVRRFNEMFANSGVIAHVTLQNPQGGVFAVSDLVGLIYDPAKSTELFFAYPLDEDADVKSVVHINSSLSEPSSPMKNGGDGSAKSSFKHKPGAKKAESGCAFTRCTKLPLPLVVALLANESERDLLSHVMKDSGRSGDDWPELALNASFLDPTREMLQVEVRWQGKSVQATNADAFLLCLQQLGLCTSRANSKHVGKVLRDRLKMNTKNPLIHAACAASTEFQAEFHALGSATDGFYESLKEVVQEDYGVYMRLKD